MADSEEQSKGFQVRDRRRFTETGEARDDASETQREKESTGPSESPPRRREESPREPVEITFSTFVMSLSTQALMLLGDIPNPMTGETAIDLEGAEEVIAMIGMLQQKTRGNLDEAETHLLEKILFDLRMRYVEKVRK